MSKAEREYAAGYLAGILSQCWTCGDCENIYESTVDECPNHMLDEAKVGVLREYRD